MIKNIVIVGGGSAGWMSATYLNSVLNRDKKNVSITLIEDSNTPSIGVGEATVHTIRDFLKICEISEPELIASTNATFKLGIEFIGWCKPENGIKHSYFHPFENPTLTNGWNIGDFWALNKHENGVSYAKSVSVSPHLCDQNLSPKLNSSNDYESPIPYAYHLDAIKLAQFLKSKCIDRGINYIDANVSKINKDKEDNISSVVANGITLTGDFFIDCTGFKSIMTKGTYNSQWHSYEKSLLCNRAVALQTPLKKGQALKPFTKSTALANGWAWEINLANRVGNGYVYSDQFIDEQQAETELLAHLNLPSSNEHKFNHIKMTPGRVDKHWNKNCLSIGLSGGFIEPLESTGIYLIELSLKYFIDHFPVKNTSQAIIDSYNTNLNDVYDELKDFIVLHYCITDRDDTAFWRAAQKTSDNETSLQKLIEKFKNKTPKATDFTGSKVLFNAYNYQFILFGMDKVPDLSRTFLATAKQEDGDMLFDRIIQFSDQAKKMHMNHNDSIQKITAPFKGIN